MVVYIPLMYMCLIFSTICIAQYTKYKKMLYLLLCAKTKTIHDSVLPILLHALTVSTEYSPMRNVVGRYPANLTKALRHNELHVDRLRQRIICTIMGDSHKAMSEIMVEQNTTGR
jgi:hypothetical protein